MKRLIATMAVLMLILGGIVASLPLFVSSSTVRTYIVNHLESLTGREVTFRGDPGVSFNPFLGIEVSDLVISDPIAGPSAPPLLKVDKIQAQLDIIPALFGDIKITQYLLLRPRLNLKTYGNGNSNWHFKKGQLHEAFRHAQATLQGDAEARSEEADLGTFIIVDGAITYEDEIAGQVENITSIKGNIDWSNTAEAASIDTTAIWHGEIVASKFDFSEPLNLMAGGESQANVVFESAPAAIEFSGSANMLSNLFIKGELTLNTPSLQRFSEFFVTGFTDIYLPGTIDMAGQIEATGDMLRITEAEISVAGHSATGVLTLGTDEISNASINGTLAFDTIDLSSFITDNSESISQLTDSTDAKAVKVDLRVSANTIDAGILNLSDVAAAVNVTADNWTVDVGDSQTLGGNLIARIGKRKEDDGPLILMEVTATNVDAAAVSELFPDRAVGITGTGNFNASLRSKNFADFLSTKGLNGSLEARLANGSITGIDMTRLLAGTVDAANNNLSDTELGDKTDFDSSKFNFFIRNGIASISQSSINSSDNRIQIIGRVD
ncbi:MAG: AsmA family protein, partial [Pseudomonadota bacterium]